MKKEPPDYTTIGSSNKSTKQADLLNLLEWACENDNEYIISRVFEALKRLP